MTLALLARAVSGAPVDVHSTSTDRAFVDGATIAVPAGDPEPATAVVVQAGLIAIGSLTPPQIKKLARAGAASVERYLVLEATRAAQVPWLLPRVVAHRVLELGAPVTPSAEASLDLARGRAAVPAAPPWLGTIRPQALRRRAVATPDEGVGEEAEQSKLLELLGAPPTKKSLWKLGSGRRIAGGGPGLETSSPTSAARAPTRVVQSETATDLTRGGVAVPGARHPEWDCHRGRYREAWCTVYDLDPRADGTPLPPVEDVPLRRALARIGSAPERRRNQREGDTLDTCALVEHMVQRHLGGTDDPRVFERRTWTARDLGVLVLLDATGSTAANPPDRAAGRALFDKQRAVVHRLATTLSELGDRTAVYAFNSRSRSDVRFLRVKDFDGRYDEGARARLASVQPADFTRLGAAVRHGARLLSSRAGTSHQLLVVVGDGLPYDDGYEDRYAREDSRIALREALATGVGCVSIGVGTSLESRVVEEVWGEVTHLHLGGPDELAPDELAPDELAPDELAQQVREAFGSALRLATSRRRAPGGSGLARGA